MISNLKNDAVGMNTKVEAAMAAISEWLQDGSKSTVLTYEELMAKLGISKLAVYGVMAGVKRRCRNPPWNIDIINIRNSGYKKSDQNDKRGHIKSTTRGIRRRTKEVIGVAQCGYMDAVSDADKTHFLAVSSVFSAIHSACDTRAVRRIESKIDSVGENKLIPMLLVEKVVKQSVRKA